MATMLFHACRISSLVTPCLKACASICTSSINSSNFVQRYSNRLYLRKLSLRSVVSRILQKRKGHPGDGCRPRHSRRPNTRRGSICTGSCDARILARAQMFVQVENRTYFRYYRHKRNARRPCTFSRHSPETEAREPAMTGQPEPPFTHICKRPHRLRNGDAALAAVGGPLCCQTTSRRRPQASAPNSKRLGLSPLGPDHVAGLGSLDTRTVWQHVIGVGLEALRAAGAPGHRPGAQRAVLGMLGS